MLSFLLSWNLIRSAWLGSRSSFTGAGLIHWFKREVIRNSLYLNDFQTMSESNLWRRKPLLLSLQEFSWLESWHFWFGKYRRLISWSRKWENKWMKIALKSITSLEKKFWNENKRKFFRENASIPSLNCHLELFSIHDCGHPRSIHRIGILMPEPFTVAIIALNLWVAYQMLSWWVP